MQVLAVTAGLVNFACMRGLTSEVTRRNLAVTNKIKTRNLEIKQFIRDKKEKKATKDVGTRLVHSKITVLRGAVSQLLHARPRLAPFKELNETDR